MERLVNRQIRLKARPNGIPQAEHFDLAAEPVRDLAHGEVLVRNRYLSVEPAMRGWVSAVSNYSKPVQIGETMRAFAVGQVVASRHADYREGDWLHGSFGWQEYAIFPGGEAGVTRLPEDGLPPSAHLGVLGLTGMTAYFALLEVGQPKPGDVVVVSTAAGSVGSCVGQIAKLKGCRTIGIAGGPEKVRQCLELFAYDAAIDYRAENIDESLSKIAPQGIDIYFDNTAGEISDAVLPHLAMRARVVVCGTASIASWDPWPTGKRVERRLLVKRARMEGFLIFDYAHRADEARTALAGWVREGKIRYEEHVLEGLDRAPGAIAMLYRGENRGKLLIRLSE